MVWWMTLAAAARGDKVLPLNQEVLEKCFMMDSDHNAVVLIMPEKNSEILETFTKAGEGRND
jgi:hypothetical protein